jgi:hypothetical protein
VVFTYLEIWQILMFLPDYWEPEAAVNEKRACLPDILTAA